jgi:hypothetical protein
LLLSANADWAKSELAHAAVVAEMKRVRPPDEPRPQAIATVVRDHIYSALSPDLRRAGMDPDELDIG